MDALVVKGEVGPAQTIQYSGHKAVARAHGIYSLDRARRDKTVTVGGAVETSGLIHSDNNQLEMFLPEPGGADFRVGFAGQKAELMPMDFYDIGIGQRLVDCGEGMFLIGPEGKAQIEVVGKE